MSSTYRSEETPIYFDSNSGYNNSEEGFTDLQSCEHPNDTDSQSSYSDSTDFDDEDNEDRQVAIHFSPLTKDNVIESNNDLDNSENENDKKTTTNLSEPTNDIRDLIHEDLYKFIFMPISKQLNDYVRCRLIRSKSSLVQTCRLEVEYDDNGKSLCILTAEKQLPISGQAEYMISVNPNFTNEFYSFELETTNITGTNYSLYYCDGNRRRQLAIILYEMNFLGINGPRKIEALLPKFNEQTQDSNDDNDISEYYSKEQNDCFIHLHNKPPDWNPFTCSYSLSFDGKNRVTRSSIKNFQMILKNEKHVEQIVMQFGRMSENEFSCDFRHPLSLIQTFGIALSALESRLFRE